MTSRFLALSDIRVPTRRYSCADIRYATGHIISRDDDDNVVFYAEQSNGARIRQLTLSKDGSVTLGTLPPSKVQQSKSGGVFVTGTVENKVRDMWQSSTSSNITDSSGQTVGTMHAVWHQEDPTWTGIQFAVNDLTMTMTDGMVAIGKVSADFLNSNRDANTKVLVGGNVNQEQVTEEVTFACADIPGSGIPACDYRYLRVQSYTAPSRPGNANGAQVKTEGYFKPGECYDICTATQTTDYTFVPAMLSGGDASALCEQETNSGEAYFKVEQNFCPPEGSGNIYEASPNARVYSDNACTQVLLDGFTIDLIQREPSDGKILDCFCPTTHFVNYLPTS